LGHSTDLLGEAFCLQPKAVNRDSLLRVLPSTPVLHATKPTKPIAAANL